MHFLIKNKGISFALLAAIISGISIFYNKVVLIQGIDATVFNIIKNGGTALLISSLLIFSKSQYKITSINKKQIGILMLIGLIGGSVPFILFFEGLKGTTALNASLIQKSLFLWASLFAIIFLKEKLTILHSAAFVLIAASNFFIGGFRGFNANTAEYLILGATILWSIEIVISKKMTSQLDAKYVVWGRMFFGTLFLCAIALIQQKFGLFLKITPAQILPIMGSIFLLTGYVLSVYHALALAPVTLVTSILILATPITNILTAVFITHSFSNTTLINALLSIGGILLLLYIASKNRSYGHTRSRLVR